MTGGWDSRPLCRRDILASEGPIVRVREGALPVLRGRHGIGWMLLGWLVIVALIAMGIVGVGTLGLFR